MQHGYLLIETREDRAGLIRIAASQNSPALPPPAEPSSLAHLRYAARFNDIDAALMHAHTALRHRLFDLESRLYRADLLQAVAAVDTIALAHRRLYLDPGLENDQRLAEQIEQRQRRQGRDALIWQGIGLGAASVLVALLLLGI